MSELLIRLMGGIGLFIVFLAVDHFFYRREAIQSMLNMHDNLFNLRDDLQQLAKAMRDNKYEIDYLRERVKKRKRNSVKKAYEENNAPTIKVVTEEKPKDESSTVDKK